MKVLFDYMRAFLNGRVVDGVDAAIPFENKSAFFDFGCYDNVKVLKGKRVFAERHALRFIQSLETLGIAPPKKEEVIEAVDLVIEANKLNNSLIRLVMYPDFFYCFPVGLTFYPDKFYANGVKAITFKGERLLPKAKTMNLLLNFLALEKAHKQDALEALLLNEKGEATEGTRSNLFIARKGKLFTPPKEDVLDGVTRELIFENFEVREENITLEKLFNADEVFVSSTSMLAMPLVEVDGKKVGRQKTGLNYPVARSVLKKLQELERKELER